MNGTIPSHIGFLTKLEILCALVNIFKPTTLTTHHYIEISMIIHWTVQSRLNLACSLSWKNCSSSHRPSPTLSPITYRRRIDDNRIFGTISTRVSQLSRLTWVYERPAIQCRRLTVLLCLWRDLSRNSLIGALPSQFGRLTNLVYLCVTASFVPLFPQYSPKKSGLKQSEWHHPKANWKIVKVGSPDAVAYFVLWRRSERGFSRAVESENSVCRVWFTSD